MALARELGVTDEQEINAIEAAALLHDLGGLLAAVRLALHLTVVCIDNDGGAIFSMLPTPRPQDVKQFSAAQK